MRVRTWLVKSALDSVESRMNCEDIYRVTCLWNTVLDASCYRVDSRLVTINGLEMFLILYQVSAFSPIVGR